MMIGMVFFSILTGTMTGVLSMTAEPKDATMFGKRVQVSSLFLLVELLVVGTEGILLFVIGGIHTAEMQCALCAGGPRKITRW